jgi:hypothetical protein
VFVPTDANEDDAEDVNGEDEKPVGDVEGKTHEEDGNGVASKVNWKSDETAESEEPGNAYDSIVQ